MRKTPAQETAARKPQCCDTRTPGQPCRHCGQGINDQTITQTQALTSNA